MLDLARAWEFTLGGRTAFGVLSTPSCRPASTVVILSGAVAGALVSMRGFEGVGTLQLPPSSLQAGSGALVLTGERLQLEIPAATLGPFILLSVDDCITVVLPYVCAPVARMNEMRLTIAGPGGGLERNDRLASDLDLLSRCSALALTCELDQWQALCALLGGPEPTGVPALVTRLEVTQAEELSPLCVSGPLLMGQDASEEHMRLAGLYRSCVMAFHALVVNGAAASLALAVPSTLHAIRQRVDATLASAREGAARQELATATQLLSGLLAGLEGLPLLVADGPPFRDALALFQSLVETWTRDAAPVAPPCPDGHMLVQRVMATPLRVVPLGQTAVKTSRVLRAYGTRHHLIIVSFRDEQGQQLRGPCLVRRMEQVMPTPTAPRALTSPSLH
jgi:hypothetical protein